LANARQPEQTAAHLHFIKIFIPNAATITALTVFLTPIFTINPVLLPVIPNQTLPKPLNGRHFFSKVFTLENMTGNF